MAATRSRNPKIGGTVRIVAGAWRRTLLSVPDEPGLRPTPDRVRETLFNWLTHAFGDLSGRSALDLFAGSGALGFEAASRGAAPVLLVDDNRRVVSELRAMRTKLAAAALDVIAGDASRVGADLVREGRRFDMVFVDPPFGRGLVETILPLAAALARPSGLVYVESERRLDGDLVAATGLETYRADKAGDVFYHLLQRKK
jgi:16S rRNA (guanine(966)-N(2))-methyltransferase RsmD